MRGIGLGRSVNLVTGDKSASGQQLLPLFIAQRDPEVWGESLNKDRGPGSPT